MQRTIFLYICTISLALSAGSVNAETQALSYSDLRADENLVFFRTSAWLNDEGTAWHVPIHGWTYEPENSAVRKALFSAVLKDGFSLEPGPDTEGNFTRRLNLMVADSERSKRIVVSIAGQQFTLSPSAANGQFETTLVISMADAKRFSDGSRLPFAAVTRKNETRVFEGDVMLVAPDGVSVISDIDDTVKISHVTDRKRLLEQTFLLDFAVVEGMPEIFSECSDAGASFHFVSSSPWQLYAPLDEFLSEAGFSDYTLNLKAVRFRDETLLDLFKKGTETKPKAIEKILNTYPGRQFYLVGDSGEHDPEVYAQIAEKYPDQILKIFIRNVTDEVSDNERFKTVFGNLSADRWELFDDARDLIPPEMCVSSL
jgi:hypothetical protein